MPTGVLEQDTRAFGRAAAPTVAVWALIAVYCITFGTLSIQQHDSFGTSIYDLGNVDQAVWNTIHGRILRFTTQPHMGDIRLSMHVEPILLPISLLYLLYSSPKTLLVVQTIGIALGAWPLYLLARWRLKRAWPAVAFAAAYLLLPALEGANLFEFHAVVLAPFFLLFAFYETERAIADAPSPGRLHKGRYALAMVFAVLAMSCKEDIPLLVATMGLYFLVFRRSWRAAVPLMALGAAWFYAAIYVVYPLVRQGRGSPFLYYYEDFGDNPLSIAANLLARPERLVGILATPDNGRYLLGLLWPFAFLPLLGLPALLIATPSLAINLLSGFELMHELEAKQYAVPIAPFVAIAAVYGAHRLSRILRRERAGVYISVALLVAGTLSYHHFRGYSPLSAAYRAPEVTAHHRLAADFIRQIPPDAPLVAQDRLFPHVSERERAYYVWTDDTDADYIWLDVSHPSFVNVNGVHDWMRRQVEKQDDFGLIDARDGYLLLRRSAPATPLPDEFYSWIRVAKPRIQHSLSVDFADAVRMAGFDVLFDRDREVQLVLYLQPLRAMGRDENLNLTLHLVDRDGRVLGATQAPQPALVWYPPERWQPGETLRVVANTLPWSTRDLPEYGLALGVSTRHGESAPALMPRLQAANEQARFLNNGSTVELMRFRKVLWMNRAIHTPREMTAPAVERPVGANFQDLARLEGLNGLGAKPGEPLRIELVWHAVAPIPDSYTVFVHLLDNRGKIAAQQDSIPSNGTLPTTAWLPGEYIRDRHSIDVPVDAPTDDLFLAIGLYRADSGQRLEVLDQGGQAVDNRVLVPLR